MFRTYNASVTLETELPTVEALRGLSVQEKVLRYNAANRQVLSTLCYAWFPIVYRFVHVCSVGGDSM